jgi:Mg2+-importing ATPase
MKLEHRAAVMRDGLWGDLPISELVPGDLISLSAGSQVPADCRLIEAKDLFVDQSSLTGESFPSPKEVVETSATASIPERMNALYAGTHVISGSATAVVVLTGKNTEFGRLARAVGATPPLTEFQLGVRHFGYLLLEVAGALALLALAINIGYGRPPLDTLLFTLALVVGMTPQLLPAIVTTTLAQGAHRLAHGSAIVRRLSSIADIGGVTILCTDKTGTLTLGAVTLEKAVGCDGRENAKVHLFGYLNALHETGYANALDDALRKSPLPEASDYAKLDEIPYDFTRRRLSILLQRGDRGLVVTKGAFEEVLSICSLSESAGQGIVPVEQMRGSIEATFQDLSREGYRVLAVAYREHPIDVPLRHEDEQEMTLLGLLAFRDPPKKTAIESVQALERYGVQCKMVTGDNRYVAAKVASELGVLSPELLLTGAEIDRLSESALQLRALKVDVFAEVGPNQKERIIAALKKLNLGVAYLGDGINDAAALRAADVGISVDTAVDATKEAADIVLITKDLNILLAAVLEGRRAFGNTLKYILITTSANFGNMFSVVGASLFADFLPLLPKQILLLNVLSDLPAMALAADKVDPEMVEKPLRWNLKTLSVSMITYGIVSSVFDYITFGVLLMIGAAPEIFRTGWFWESLISEIFVLLVIRTPRQFWRSSIGHGLLAMSILSVGVGVALPYSPLAETLGFAPLSFWYIHLLVIIIAAYVMSSEFAKRHLRKREERFVLNPAQTASAVASA